MCVYVCVRVYMCAWVCIYIHLQVGVPIDVWCASHADEMKNGGRLKYMCLQNVNRNNKGYMCFRMHVALTRPRLSRS